MWYNSNYFGQSISIDSRNGWLFKIIYDYLLFSNDGLLIGDNYNEYDLKVRINNEDISQGLEGN